MRITSLRTHKGELPSTDTLLKLERMLNKAFNRAGFVTHVTLGDSRANMKIGLHMCSFKIDTEKLGHNADFSYAARTCKAGFKRTCTPTWAQRESFNHIVNDAFDKFKLSARIMSGDFEVRSKTSGRVNNWDACSHAWGERALQIRSLPAGGAK